MAGIFQTPPNEKSFSSLIDDAILATGKPGSLIAAIQHANLTIKECQSLGLFAPDLIEDTLTSTSDGSFIWDRPWNFRVLRTVQYRSAITGCKEYPPFIAPGRKQKEHCEYFYAADDYFVFNGVSNGSFIDTAIYYWAKRLGYYALLGQNTNQYPGGPYTPRLAYYDTLLDKWQYLNATSDGYIDTTGVADTDKQYRDLSSNWLTRQYYELILSGTKAKVWNSSGDPRGNIEYSLYKQNQAAFRTTISSESQDF